MILSKLEWLNKIANDMERAQPMCNSWASCYDNSHESWRPVFRRTLLRSRSLFLRSTVSVVLALPTSKMSACRCRILLFGALSARRSVVTCLFLEQEQWSSVDGVSRWLLRSSGIHYRLTYLRSPLISRGQFLAGLKIHLFKQAYSLWEHFALRV